MPTTTPTIDEVLHQLDLIIQDCHQRNDPLGYFPVLYRKVTVKVKEGIAAGFFADGPRMERLDVVFAQRYLDGYQRFRQKEQPTQSWMAAFQLGKASWPIVLQHLLVGINAHINLDLGIAAATISQGKDLEELRGDFNKINEILAALVNDVEADLVAIWPRLSKIIKWMGGAENLLMDFSMELARNGAWKFAQELHQQPSIAWSDLIQARDLKVVKMARVVIGQGWLLRMLFRIIRWGEKGSVAQKMDQLAE